MTGMTLAHDLGQEGLRVCLIDQYDQAGGNHLSEQVGDMSFDIGAIFHWSDSKLFEMFPALRDQCVPVTWRTDRINPDGEVVAYPFDYKREFFQRSPIRIAKIALGVLKHRLFTSPNKNAASFLNHYLGAELVKTSGVGAFVERFYGLPAQDITADFAKARMIHIVQGASVSHIVKRAYSRIRRSPAKTKNQCLARPKSGFGELYDIAVRQMTASGIAVRLGCDVETISKTDHGFRLQTSQEEISASRVISTIPIIETAKKIGFPTENAPTSLALHSLYFRFKGALGFEGPILYNFQDRGRWKRLTLHSQYYGDADGWSYFTIETTARANEKASADTFERDFRTSIDGLSILKGELELVGHRETEFAYPLYDASANAQRDALLEQISAFGVETVGRQGRFDYLPITQLAIIRARQLLKSSASLVRKAADPA